MPCTLFRSYLCKTCRVLDGVAAAAYQKVRSYDVFYYEHELVIIFSDIVMRLRLNLPTAPVYCTSSYLLHFLLPPLLRAAVYIRSFAPRLLLLHLLMLCVCLCRRLTFMLVVHTAAAVLTPYVRVSSYLNLRRRTKEGR